MVLFVSPALLRKNRPMMEMVVSDDEGESDRETQTTAIDEYTEIANGDTVQLCHIVDYKRVFVRATKYDEQFCNLMMKINARPEKPLDTSVEKGDSVLVKHSGDLSRGVVIGFSPSISVQLIDLGAMKNVQTESLRKMSQDLTNDKRFAVPVELSLPERMSEMEETAVVQHLEKWKHNCFTIKVANQLVLPNTPVQLLHIENGISLTKPCLQKRFYIEDIHRKRINAENVTAVVIEQEHLTKNFICCVLKSDFTIFVKQFNELLEYGRTILAHNHPYYPDNLELCLVCYPDEDQAPCWYRAQFQQRLFGNRAQVGLIDYAISAVVKMSDIRKFDAERFGYDQISLNCKLRSECISLDLLNTHVFQNFSEIDTKVIQPAGDFHELFLPDKYFFVDDNFEELLLTLED